MKIAIRSSWLAAFVVVEACGGPGSRSRTGYRRAREAPRTPAREVRRGAPNVGAGAVNEPGVLFIQEDELGFSGVDGKVLPREGSTSVAGYTGTGFADGDPGIGKSIGYSVRPARPAPFSSPGATPSGATPRTCATRACS